MAGQLSDSERAYYRRLVGQMKAVQTAFESYVTHLVEFHGLSTVDRITEDGLIVRATPPDADDQRAAE